MLACRYFTFLDECKSPKACTILLRGPSKDILNEIDRNLADAMSVARNVVFNPILTPGGGATEMAISVALAEKAKMLPGVAGAPYKAISDALEVDSEDFDPELRGECDSDVDRAEGECPHTVLL